MTLGMTNGSVNAGTAMGSTTYYTSWSPSIVGYGANVGSNTPVNMTGFTVNQGIGVTTDSSKSGIIVEPDTDIKLVIKY